MMAKKAHVAAAHLQARSPGRSVSLCSLPKTLLICSPSLASPPASTQPPHHRLSTIPPGCLGAAPAVANATSSPQPARPHAQAVVQAVFPVKALP